MIRITHQLVCLSLILAVVTANKKGVYYFEQVRE